MLIESFGWRNALRILGGFGALLICLALTLLERRLPLQNTSFFTTPKELIKLRNYRFFLAASFFFQFGFFVPFVHLGPFTIDAGFTEQDAALAVALLGVGSSVGRVTLGPSADFFGRCVSLLFGRVRCVLSYVLLTFPTGCLCSVCRCFARR